MEIALGANLRSFDAILKLNSNFSIVIYFFDSEQNEHIEFVFNVCDFMVIFDRNA